MTKPSFVQADNLDTVPKRRLVEFLGALDSETMLAVAQKFVLALELESAMPHG